MVVGYFIAKKYGYVRKGDKAQKLSVSETLNTIWRAIPQPAAHRHYHRRYPVRCVQPHGSLRCGCCLCLYPVSFIYKSITEGYARILVPDLQTWTTRCQC